MVNSLSSLAQFLEDESLPLWLKQQLQARREEISQAFERGESITLRGPNGESVSIAPRPLAAAVA
jgi:hypothetical protein